MRAAVVTEFGGPLQVEELDLPTPGYGEALVKLETSGVCHTDLHAAHGDWPVKPQPPFIPGHEGYGTVVALGEGVDDLKVDSSDCGKREPGGHQRGVRPDGARSDRRSHRHRLPLVISPTDAKAPRRAETRGLARSTASAWVQLVPDGGVLTCDDAHR
jgi:Alcohol dehydrogenase GroES-like domain